MDASRRGKSQPMINCHADKIVLRCDLAEPKWKYENQRIRERAFVLLS
jgi:hypothetical protein